MDRRRSHNLQLLITIVRGRATASHLSASNFGSGCEADWILPRSLPRSHLPAARDGNLSLALRPESDVVIAKTRPGLFVGTPARDILAGHKVETLVLTGVTTDRGILATARSAVRVGMLPMVVADGVAPYNDGAHEMACALRLR